MNLAEVDSHQSGDTRETNKQARKTRTMELINAESRRDYCRHQRYRANHEGGKRTCEVLFGESNRGPGESHLNDREHGDPPEMPAQPAQLTPKRGDWKQDDRSESYASEHHDPGRH
jgi:hypothetical protein